MSLHLARVLFLMSGLLMLNSCGVKNDPLPPLTPTEIGHGQPVLRKAKKSTKPKAPILDNEAEEEDEKEK